MLADGDPTKEKQYRKEDYFSFINRIFTMSKKAKAEEAAQHHEAFGRQK